jgi:hypothetical protein
VRVFAVVDLRRPQRLALRKPSGAEDGLIPLILTLDMASGLFKPSITADANLLLDEKESRFAPP